jgi:hypothetical protein
MTHSSGRSPFLLLSISLTGILLGARVVTGAVDLRISDDETYKRPNSWSLSRPPADSQQGFLFAEAAAARSRPGISIAWRNANQIEEVEVRVQNTGDQPGEGRVSVDVLDEAGQPLLHLEPPDESKIIRVPAFARGGREGKILRMKASWELNDLIDRFDRSRTRYGVKATIETIGPDANWSDNAKVKEWNLPYGVRPGAMSVFNYVFTNTDARPHRVQWQVDQTDPPPGWQVEGIPDIRAAFEMAPGQKRTGTLSLKTPVTIVEGAFLETRLALIDVETRRVIQQHEWFQIYDTIQPTVTNYRAVLLADHTLAIQALVADQHSGVLEATGVSTQFSVDGGKTWSGKTHGYKVGNFVRPTLFEAVLGPFAPGTKVLVRLMAVDTAGNAQTAIPADAAAFRAPPTAELLIQQAYVFPRTRANPVFELEKLKQLNVTLQELRSLNVDVRSIDLTKPNPLGVDAERLKEVGLDSQRIIDLKDDLTRLADLKFDVAAIQVVPVRRVAALGEPISQRSTLEFTIP